MTYYLILLALYLYAVGVVNLRMSANESWPLTLTWPLRPFIVLFFLVVFPIAD